MNVVKGKKITGFVVNICRCFKYNRHRSVALAYKARKLTLYYINNVDKILTRKLKTYIYVICISGQLTTQNLTNYIEWRESESIRHWTSLFCVKLVTTVKTNTSGKKTCFSSNFDLKKSLLVYEIGIPPLNTSQKFSYQRKKSHI